MEIFNRFKKNIPENLINKDNIESINSIIEPQIFDKKILNCIIYPIYYFFDGYLNPEIGSTKEVRNELRKLYQLDKIFDLEYDSIINIPSNVHSTILCKFELNNKKYLYYSNSGLGIHNNLRFNIENNKFVSPKIFEVKDDSMYDLIPKYIEFILSKIINLDEDWSKTDYIYSEENILNTNNTLNMTLNNDINIIKNKLNNNYYHRPRRHTLRKIDTKLIIPYNKFISENINTYSFLENIKIDVSDFEEIVKKIVESESEKGGNLINLCYSLLY